MNNNYYQSDIKTSRQEDVLLSINDDRKHLLGLIEFWEKECFRYKKENKAYENMRKEAIEYIKNDMKLKNYFEITERGADDLLNILNKVGGSDE